MSYDPTTAELLAENTELKERIAGLEALLMSPVVGQALNLRKALFAVTKSNEWGMVESDIQTKVEDVLAMSSYSGVAPTSEQLAAMAKEIQG